MAEYTDPFFSQDLRHHLNTHAANSNRQWSANRSRLVWHSEWNEPLYDDEYEASPSIQWSGYFVGAATGDYMHFDDEECSYDEVPYDPEPDSSFNIPSHSTLQRNRYHSSGTLELANY